jgi:AraC-like DNA-binding protein
MINIEAKKQELILQLAELLTVYAKFQVYYAEPSEQISLGSNVSRCDRLAVPLSGCHRMEIFTDGKITTICPGPGGVTFMPKGIWNHPDWILPVKTATFGFEEDKIWISLVECYGNSDKQAVRIVVPGLGTDGDLLFKLLKQCFVEHQDDRSGVMLKLLMYYILDSMRSPVVSSVRGKAYHTWGMMTGYLEEYYDANISREDVAAIFKLAPNYVSFLFKQQSGIGFSEYLNKLRLNKACFLLKSYNQTLDEVALAVGFSSAAYFCRLFKKYNGMTPTKYRNRSS